MVKVALVRSVQCREDKTDIIRDAQAPYEEMREVGDHVIRRSRDKYDKEVLLGWRSRDKEIKG